MSMSAHSDVEAVTSDVRINTADLPAVARSELSVPETDIASEDNSASNNKYPTTDLVASECLHHTDFPHRPTLSASSACRAVTLNDVLDDPSKNKEDDSSKLATDRNSPTSTPRYRSRST